MAYENSNSKLSLNFNGGKNVLVNNQFYITIPKGYQYSTDSSKIGYHRMFTMVPTSYDISEDPMEAPFALSIQSHVMNNSMGVNAQILLLLEDEAATRMLFCKILPSMDSNVEVTVVRPRAGLAVLFQRYTDFSDSSYNKIIALILADENIYAAHVVYNHPGVDSNSQNVTHEFDEAAESLFATIRLKSESAKASLPHVRPEENLYPHYGTIKNNALRLLGAQVNTTGTEFQWQSFSQLIRECDNENEDAKAMYQRMLDLNPAGYSLDKKAKAMMRLFHVNESIFNPANDRETELAHCMMRRAYMLSALRSFAWTAADYCKQNEIGVDEIDEATAVWIAKFIEDREWLNYDGKTYCKGLCSGSDLHVYFLPDAATKADKQEFLPSEEDLARVQEIKAMFPGYREILCEVHSLDALRKDLEYIYPAIEVLYNHLAENRDSGKVLEGAASDVVYAWIAMALAAAEPFFTEDGPARYHLDQPGDWYYSDAEKHVPCAKSGPKVSGRSAAEDVLVITGTKAAKKDCEIDYLDVLTSYRGSKSAIVLPEGITGIGTSAFSFNRNLTTVVIPEGVRTIEWKAFMFCNSLEAVALPASLYEIQWKAFQFCDKLTTIVIPDGCNKIEFEAFDGCSKLRDIYVPESVWSIGTDAFNTGNDETVIHTPAGSAAETYAIDNGMQYDHKVPPVVKASKETTAKRAPKAATDTKAASKKPASITYESNMEWPEPPSKPDMSDCVALTSSEYKIDKLGGLEKYTGTKPKILLPQGIKKINSFVFQDSKVEEVVVPEGIACIDSFAFSYTDSLRKVWLPDSLQQIDNYAFTAAGNLEEIFIPDRIQSIGSNTFESCQKLRRIRLPEGLRRIEESAFEGCAFVCLRLPEGVQTLGKRAFAACTVMRDIYIPASVREIHNTAFTGCRKLTIHTPAGSYAAQWAMEKNMNLVLTEANLENNENYWRLPGENPEHPYDETAQYAFNEELTEICIPGGVKKIAEGRFKYCKNLVRVRLPEGLESIDKEAFAQSGIQRLCLPEGVGSIGVGAFSDCANLTDIYIPSSTVDIKATAFKGVKNLTIHTPAGSPAAYWAISKNIAVIFEESPEDVGKPLETGSGVCPPECVRVTARECQIKDGEVVLYVGKAKRILLPEGIRTVSRNTAWKDLKVVAIPEGVETIEKEAFMFCTNLERVYLPSTLKEIQESAFSWCTKLEEIHIPDGVVQLGAGTFSNCSMLTKVTIGEGVKKLPAKLFEGCSELREVHLPASVKAILRDSFDRSAHQLVFRAPKKSWAVKWALENKLTVAKECMPQEHIRDSYRYLDDVLCNYVGASVQARSPEGITKIPSRCYAETKVREIHIAEGITAIGNEAFQSCPALETLILPDSLTKAIPEDAINSSPKLLIVCGAGSKGEAFAKQKNIPYYTKALDAPLPKGLWIRDGIILRYDGSDRELVLPEGITTITKNAFRGNTFLVKLQIPGSVKTIEDGAFSGCLGILQLCVAEGSAAWQYAKNKHMEFYCGTIPEAKAFEQEQKRLAEEAARYKTQVMNYNQACERFRSASSASEYVSVIALLERAGDYADTKVKQQIAERLLEATKKLPAEISAVKSKEEEIAAAEKELSGLGFLQLGKKKELKARLESLQAELQTLQANVETTRKEIANLRSQW